MAKHAQRALAAIVSIFDKLTSATLRARRGTVSRAATWSCMPTFETIDPKLARRCRYDQHRDQKTTLTLRGSSVTAFVRSVMEVRSSTPKRWIVTLVVKPRIAA